MRIACTDWAALAFILFLLQAIGIGLAVMWLDRRARARHDRLVAMLDEETPDGLSRLATSLAKAAKSVDAARETVGLAARQIAGTQEEVVFRSEGSFGRSRS